MLLSPRMGKKVRLFYRLFLASGNPDYRYTQEDVDSYEDSVAFLDYLIGLPVDDPGFVVGTELRRLAPQLG